MVDGRDRRGAEAAAAGVPAGAAGSAAARMTRLRLPAWLPGRTVRRALWALVALCALWGFLRAGPALVVRVDAGPPDVIVMLASHEWERLPATAALARRYPDSQVLLTLPRRISPFNCYRCLDRSSWLQAEGVAAGRIAQLPWTTTNTWDEAIAVRRLHDVRPFERVLVVTSPYHTRRALHVFRTAFRGRSVAIGIEPATGAEAQPGTWWWHRYDRHYVAYEWAAIAFYRYQFRVPIFRG